MKDTGSKKHHIPRVHVDLPIAVGTPLVLPEAKRHHLITVLRKRAGDRLVVFNGDGAEYEARLVRADRKQAEAEISTARRPERESPVAITLIQAIARGDRMDFALAKAVELGVTRIEPVFSERGQVKLEGERLAKKTEHWQRVVESAAEQSGRLICPALAAPMTVADRIGRPIDAAIGLMLAPEAGTGLAELSPKASAALIIGPESGLSNAEITAAETAGWQGLRLGPRILRTETAGMAALAALQSLWGDLLA